jgi:hypothetical protein
MISPTYIPNKSHFYGTRLLQNGAEILNWYPLYRRIKKRGNLIFPLHSSPVSVSDPVSAFGPSIHIRIFCSPRAQLIYTYVLSFLFSLGPQALRFHSGDRRQQSFW